MSDVCVQTWRPSPLTGPREIQQADIKRTLQIRRGSYHLRLAAGETDRLAAVGMTEDE